VHLPVELCQLPEAAGTQEEEAAAISAGEVDDQAIKKNGPEGEDAAAAVVAAAGTVIIGTVVAVEMIGRAPGHDHVIAKRRRRRRRMKAMIGVEAVLLQSLKYTAARVALLDLSGR